METIKETYGNKLHFYTPMKEGHLLAMGPVTKQPATMAYRRVLLASKPHQFKVTTEFFPHYDGNGNTSLSDSAYGQGFYYSSGQLSEALAKFAELVGYDAEYYIDSLKRKEVATSE